MNKALKRHHKKSYYATPYFAKSVIKRLDVLIQAERVGMETLKRKISLLSLAA